MKYFISHSFLDEKWVKDLVEIIKEIHLTDNSEASFFYSSNPDVGSDYTEGLLKNIDANMQDSEIVILVVTENFLRSSYCNYELNVASFLQRKGKKTLVLVQNEDLQEIIKYAFPDTLCIVATSPDAANILIHALFSNNVSTFIKNKIDTVFNLMKIRNIPVGKPFFGMTKKEYDDAFSFVEKYNIEKITFGYPSAPEIIEKHLKDAEEIIFVSTTGSGFLKNFKKVLSYAVSIGVNLNVVVADPNSQFCKDIGELEVLDFTDDISSNNVSRIVSEFKSTTQYLDEIRLEAQNKTKSTLGVIKCCCGHTLLRQTSFMIRKKDSSIWGWITCTMPPERTANNTPSIVVSGSYKANEFATVMWEYGKSLLEFAIQKDNYFVIGKDNIYKFETQNIQQPSILKESEEYWVQKQKSAKKNMDSRKKIYKNILIEVAAQHPLVFGREPNEEFVCRLDEAIKLYNEFSKQGISVTIYVPGSKHKYEGVADDISLSEAGCSYLIKNGIPRNVLLGEEMNMQYKGEDGVYNSADECYVSSQIYKNGEYGKLICICSPNQTLRKTMLYIEFGCFPIIYNATADEMFHSDAVSEIFNSLNTVLYFDHSWQNKNSDLYKYYRKTRKV